MNGIDGISLASLVGVVVILVVMARIVRHDLVVSRQVQQESKRPARKAATTRCTRCSSTRRGAATKPPASQSNQPCGPRWPTKKKPSPRRL